MGFGVIIASGVENKILSDKLLDSLTEVRVEQSLDEPTRFAIRFQEDIAGGQPFLMDSFELRHNQMVTIAVEVDGAMKCLVRGPITDMKSSFQLGGPGSWYQIYGQDRRVQMDRKVRYEAWTGEATQVANAILDDYTTFERGKGEEAGPAYGGKREGQRQTTSTLNQRESDLAFLLKIVRSYGLHFWIEYTCERDRLDPTGPSLKVKEKINLNYSPPRPQGAPAGPVSVKQIKLSKTVDLVLRVNVEKQRGPNVTAFELTMDPERPNQFAGKTVDDTSVKPHGLKPSSAEPPVVKGGRQLADYQQHDLSITTAGNPEELQKKGEAALSEAGWFVHATASTTAHMFCGVLAPHDIVQVEGLGNVHSGPYQVEAVTHVITAADHFMDIQLRRNTLGRG